MNNYQVVPLQSLPGIQRDGTVYDSENFIDGQNTRFYNNKPRKMGGCKAVNYGTNEIIRNMFAVARDINVDVYLGRANSLSYISLPVDDNVDIQNVDEVERTPTGFVANPENSWSFDLFTSVSDDYPVSQILAQVCPNASSINNSIKGPIYYGPINTDAPLTPIVDSVLGPIQCSGGIVFLSPILVAYGNDGKIQWTDPNATDSLNTWRDSSNAPLQNTIANTKIVYITPIIGASVPTGLFWSLNSLGRITYTPVVTDGAVTYVFASTIIDSNISIISNTCVVSYKQTYFWIGIDQFYMYDGVVQPIPNTMNRNWFFNNVNLKYRNKIFGIVIPEWDEIRWYFTLKDGTENGAFIAYNPVGKFWYDSRNGRSAGIQTNLFPKPLLADSEITTLQTRRGPQDYYLLWEHETGYDKVIGNNSFSIPSHYTHHIMDIFSNQGGQNRLTRSRRLEPDISLIGNMQFSILNMMWAADYYNGNILVDGPYTFDRNTRYVDTASQGRLVALKFESNEIGGFFQGGKTLYDWEVGDVNP